MPALAESIERERNIETIPCFIVSFNENGNFDPAELDKFAERFNSKNNGDDNKPSRQRLHWVATETEILFFPEEISHTKFYRYLERIGEESKLRAAGVYIAYPTPRGVDRHLCGNSPLALTWIMTPGQSEKFRMGIIRGTFGKEFIFYNS